MIPVPSMSAGDLGVAAPPLPLQIAFVGRSGVQGSGKDMVLTQPVGIQPGDLGLIIIRFSGSATATFPAGWTQGAHSQLYYRVYGENEPTATVALSSTVNRVAILTVWRNVHQTAPFSATSSTSIAGGTTLTGTGVTAAHDRTVLVSVASLGVASGTPSLTIPAGTTEAYRRTGTNVGAGVAYAPGPTNGNSTGSVSWISTISTFSARVANLLLRPADT